MIQTLSGDPGLAIVAGPAESGLEVGPGGPEGAHLGLASRPVGAGVRLGNAVLSAFASTAFDDAAGARSVDEGTHGMALSWSPKGERTGLRAGLVRERETLYGAGAQGAFGRLSSGLAFVGASGAFEAGGWRVGIAGEIGRAVPEAANGMLADAGASAFSTAFSAEAVRPLAGGTLRLLLAQPLRVESGRLELSFPTGRTPEGAVVRKGVRVDLEPGPSDRSWHGLDRAARDRGGPADRRPADPRAGPSRRPEPGSGDIRRPAHRDVAAPPAGLPQMGNLGATGEGRRHGQLADHGALPRRRMCATRGTPHPGGRWRLWPALSGSGRARSCRPSAAAADKGPWLSSGLSFTGA